MTRVVAIQPRLRLGEVEHNLRRVEDLVRQAAREHQPDAVFLPEAMTSPNAYGPQMHHVARPLLGAPLEVLRRLAREHGCLVGGGFLAVRGDEVRGTYALCEPDGAIHLHDKDLPSFWENAYSSPGVPGDDGVAQTALGPIGLACGWEWGRTRTVERLRGRVRLLGGGMHFLSYPSWPLTRPWFARDEELLVQYARELPGRVARMLGVPVAQPSHVGELDMATPMAPGVRWRTRMLGETQVCDADGLPLARMAYADGEGYVAAEVELAEPAPRDPAPRTFWNASFPLSAHLVWHVGNAHGRAQRALRARLGRNAWRPGPDLPAHVPAAQAPPLTDDPAHERAAMV
ncbi:carbon-nitrogen hydrolase family protein [Conexibacter sp. SYSU D00693]|uniref:carbon-nitrogen hydrolase family protein n=1 Tax=Conexibacter sp. SYSU D00693 TaxID=2812560 RepID=UPI00196B708A|nr:carbon-nitrogen hydrolase family protein [Conexibacter sp. SYSU D00693]